mgnify:CR=1 FL=1
MANCGLALPEEEVAALGGGGARVEELALVGGVALLDLAEDCFPARFAVAWWEVLEFLNVVHLFGGMDLHHHSSSSQRPLSRFLTEGVSGLRSGRGRRGVDAML